MPQYDADLMLDCFHALEGRPMASDIALALRTPYLLGMCQQIISDTVSSNSIAPMQSLVAMAFEAGTRYVKATEDRNKDVAELERLLTI